MERRDFLKALICGGTGFVLGGCRVGSLLQASLGTATPDKGTPDLSTVAIKRFGEERDAAKAVRAALDAIGGMEKVVKSGEVVVIKPNLVCAIGGRWVGRVTNSKAMDGVISAVVDCGGKPIVAEGTCEELYGTTLGFARETGLLDVCKRYGAKFVDLNNEEPVRVAVPQPILWPEVYLARAALECDRFISVPCMKVHRAAGVTLGMKNLVGLMSPKIYGSGGYVRYKIHNLERQLWNQRYGGELEGEDEVSYWAPLAGTVADLASARPIHLVVVDGTFGDERNAPYGDLVDIKERSGSYLALAGRDIVAVDAVGAHIMRQMPKRLQKLRFAASKGLGESRLEKIRVIGERLEDVAAPMRGYLSGSYVL